MSRRDAAVSEVVSFLLVAAVLAAGVSIYAVVIAPEQETSAESFALKESAAEFASLKADIDMLWLAGAPGDSRGKLLPASVGFHSYGTGTQISFQHAGGEKTVFLAEVTARPFGTELIYEGGALFLPGRAVLPAVTGEKNAVLICTETADTVLLSNTPIVLTCIRQRTATFSGVCDLQVTSSRSRYWQEVLSGVTTLTCVFCTFSAEAVV